MTVIGNCRPHGPLQYSPCRGKGYADSKQRSSPPPINDISAQTTDHLRNRTETEAHSSATVLSVPATSDLIVVMAAFLDARGLSLI